MILAIVALFATVLVAHLRIQTLSDRIDIAVDTIAGLQQLTKAQSKLLDKAVDAVSAHGQLEVHRTLLSRGLDSDTVEVALARMADGEPVRVVFADYGLHLPETTDGTAP